MSAPLNYPIFLALSQGQKQVYTERSNNVTNTVSILRMMLLTIIKQADHDIITAVQGSMGNRRHILMITC